MKSQSTSAQEGCFFVALILLLIGALVTRLVPGLYYLGAGFIAGGGLLGVFSGIALLYGDGDEDAP